MRKVICLLVLLWGMPTLADTVMLVGEGSVDGTVDSIVLENEGVSQTILRGSFMGIMLGDGQLDVVKMDNGLMLKGAVTSIQVKTVGGILKFKRADLRSISVTQMKTDALRKEYLTKRAAVKDSDAKGLCELADWCRQNGLKAEANDLAQLSLNADPNSEGADLAHQILGQVLVDGKWQDPAPPEKPGDKPSEEPGDKPADKPPDGPEDKPGDKPGDTTEPAGARKIAPEVLAMVKSLHEEYKGKADAAAEAEQTNVKNRYRKDWDTMNATVKQCAAEVDRLNASISKLRKDRTSEMGRSGYNRDTVRNYEKQIDDAMLDRDKKESDLSASMSRRNTLQSKIRSAQKAAKSRAQVRLDRVLRAKGKIERLLVAGRELSEADMRTVFEDALRDSK